ncbi:hypothetical protein KY334_08315 [Candidatus Woesearchaeota archaeon]|nr:hypothetical protein [Candidatus Woesearchaeota archaeon]
MSDDVRYIRLDERTNLDERVQVPILNDDIITEAELLTPQDFQILTSRLKKQEDPKIPIYLLDIVPSDLYEVIAKSYNIDVTKFNYNKLKKALFDCNQNIQYNFFGEEYSLF